MLFTCLHPSPGAVDASELLAAARLADRAPHDRPYTLVNFIASADGRATFAGRSGQLSDAGDRVMFHTLREHAEAVLVGTGTLTAERYGRMIPDADRRARRVAAGLAPEPITCLITRSGTVPADIPLFAAPEARVVVFTGAELDLSAAAADVEVVALPDGEAPTLAALRHLRAELGIRLVLCEGGPLLTGALLHERTLDELFLTIAPKLTGGGTAPAVTAGPELDAPAGLALEWVLEREATLFLRYRLNTLTPAA